MTLTEDLDRIMAVMEASFDPLFGEAWTRRQVEDALLFGNCRYALYNGAGEILGASDEPAGFYLVRQVADEVELLLIAVVPKYRTVGVGTKLISQMLSEAANFGAVTVFLEMREGNPAQKLYSRNGFFPVGLRKGYYRLGDGQRINAVTFAHNIVHTKSKKS